MAPTPKVKPNFDHNIADVVAYARYSSSGQNDQSIDGQLEACSAYASQHGFRVVGEYIDRGITGTNADGRPEFQRMIRDAKKKGFQYILVWKLDRFSRNRYDSAIYKQELKKHGVRVLSVTEGINEGADSLLLEAILEAMAEEYSRSLSQNVRRGMKQNAEKSLTLGGSTPLGYDVVDKQFVINEKEAHMVRFIFTAYADGTSKAELVGICNQKGWRTKKGKAFTINSFANMLKNPIYLGHYVFKGEVLAEGVLPSIIDQSLFDKVQSVIARNKRAPAANKAKVDYLLRGKLFCGYCGSPMVGESGRSKNGTVHHYYTCATRKKMHTCKKHNEKKEYLEWYIVEQITLHVLTPDAIDKIAAGIVAEYEKSFGVSNIKALEKQLQDIDRELDSLTDKLIATDNPRVIKRINERADVLSAQYDDISLDLASLKAISLKALDPKDIKRWLNQFVNRDPLDLAVQRKIIDTFVSAVYLYDDKVAIYFNIDHAAQISYIEVCTDMEDLECSDLNGCGVPNPHLRMWIFLFVKSPCFSQ